MVFAMFGLFKRKPKLNVDLPKLDSPAGLYNFMLDEYVDLDLDLNYKKSTQAFIYLVHEIFLNVFHKNLFNEKPFAGRSDIYYRSILHYEFKYPQRKNYKEYIVDEHLFNFEYGLNYISKEELVYVRAIIKYYANIYKKDCSYSIGFFKKYLSIIDSPWERTIAEMGPFNYIPLKYMLEYKRTSKEELDDYIKKDPLLCQRQ